MIGYKWNKVMKANETPEKIYMTPSFGEPDNVLLASFSKSHLNFHRDIEYTRTDAFIEKAAIWLNLCFITHDEYGVISTQFDTEEEMLEDFKNYMKGE